MKELTWQNKGCFVPLTQPATGISFSFVSRGLETMQVVQRVNTLPDFS